MRLALALLAFVFLIYAPTLNYPYFFDDNHYIQNNAAIHSSANLLKLWTSASYYSVTPENWGYRPFTTFIHSLAWLTGGGATWPFHVEKILLHALVCFFLALIWGKLWTQPGFFPSSAPTFRFKWGSKNLTWTATPSAAAIALAFVFAAHPVNTQVLIYISATTTLLSGCCYLGAYYFYLRFRESPRGALLMGSFALYALAVLAKEEGITLVGVIILTELFLPNGKRRKFAMVGYITLAVLLALLLKFMFAESSNIARGSITRWDYFMTQWRAYLHYFRLLLWPSGLNADNLEFGFSSSFLDIRVIAALLGNLFVLGWAWAKRKRYPVFLFSLLWFYLAVSPASSIIPLAEPVNDHRMYIAYFGLIGAIFPWILKGIDRAFRNFSGVTATITFLALIVATEARNQVWASQESLWGDTVEKNPTSPRALNNLALVYMAEGDWTRALEFFDRCLQVGPTYTICKANRAIVLTNVGRDSEAEQEFRDAIAMEPYQTKIKYHYARFLVNHGRLTEALTYFKDVDQTTSGADLEAKIGWARAAMGLGRHAEAMTVIQDARRHFGDQPQLMGILSELGGR